MKFHGLPRFCLLFINRLPKLFFLVRQTARLGRLRIFRFTELLASTFEEIVEEFMNDTTSLLATLSDTLSSQFLSNEDDRCNS
jgi:hypothetical protein